MVFEDGRRELAERGIAGAGGRRRRLGARTPRDQHAGQDDGEPGSESDYRHGAKDKPYRGLRPDTPGPGRGAARWQHCSAEAPTPGSGGVVTPRPRSSVSTLVFRRKFGGKSRDALAGYLPHSGSGVFMNLSKILLATGLAAVLVGVAPPAFAQHRGGGRQWWQWRRSAAEVTAVMSRRRRQPR